MKRRRTTESKPSSAAIRGLQAMVLRAVLLGEPLPGTRGAVRFPDLAFLLRHDSIYLTDDNLAGRVSVKGSPKPIRTLSRASLLKQTREGGDLVYLQFGPPRMKGNTVELTLEGKIAPQDPSQPSLGLSAIHVKFRKAGGSWEAIGEPSFSAA